MKQAPVLKYWIPLCGLIVVAASSCSKPPGSPASAGQSPHIAHPPDMVVAFADGRSFTNELGRFALKVQQLPDLVVTSGKVIACDAFVFEDEPLKEKLSPGRYPIILSVAQFSKDNDQRVAFAQLQLSTNAPVKWRRDVTYGVDSGTGCFMDQDALRLLEQKQNRNPNSFDDIIKTMEKTYQPTWSWGNIGLDASTGLNQIAFSSGFGDGAYDTYIGYDSAGGIVCIVTDFGILNP